MTGRIRGEFGRGVVGINFLPYYDMAAKLIRTDTVRG
jgi:hypothetical protein